MKFKILSPNMKGPNSYDKVTFDSLEKAKNFAQDKDQSLKNEYDLIIHDEIPYLTHKQSHEELAYHGFNGLEIWQEESINISCEKLSLAYKYYGINPEEVPNQCYDDHMYYSFEVEAIQWNAIQAEAS